MSLEFVKSFIIPLLVPVFVGFGSSYMTLSVSTVRLEERMATLERSVVRHETDTTKRVERHDALLAEIAKRDAEQEQRLVRGESFIDAMRGDLSEIKADLKQLLRGDNGKR